MRILTRYILLELLKVFGVTLACMTVFMFMGLIGKVAVDNGLGLLATLRMAPYVLPQAMQFAVPGSLLLATVTVFGRVAASNEIVAIKSLGVSPMTLIWPTLILACGVSFAAVVLNDVAVSWGRGGVQKVILDSLEEIVYGRLRTVRSFSNERVKVTVRRVEGRRLIQPTFLFFASRDKPAWTVTADEAEISGDAEGDAVLIRLVNADIEFGGKGAANYPGVWPLTVSLEDFGGQHGQSRSTSNYPLREIGPSRVAQVALIEQTEQEMAADAAHAMLSGRMFELSEDRWRSKEIQLGYANNRLNRLRTEPFRRWANGFSCLFFVMIGAPMAIRLQHGEIWGSFFACFLPILILYYPLLMVGVDNAKAGIVPPAAVWLGNLVLAVWGVWLLRRVVRF